MAEVLVGAVVTVLIEKLSSTALMNFAQSQGIDPQLEDWKNTLSLFQSVLADASQKEIKNQAVNVWLNELQELAYDIDDVLDDISTKVLKQHIRRSQLASNSTRSKLLKMLPTCCTNSTEPSKLTYGQKISSKLDVITSNMKKLCDRKQFLGLVENWRVDRSDRTTTSSVNMSKVLGREKDKAALIGKLLLGSEDACINQNVISIVSIVGLGGLGKTTLAQLLYNDQRVKDHFKPMAWVCVSDDFDVFNISRQIYQAVRGEDKKFANLDLLHAALKEKLSKKRFLVVLDDVWSADHNKWDLLISAFDAGAHGSKILVTTRNKEVALVMDSLQPYMLKVLSKETSLSLLAQYALDEQNFDHHPSLKLIAQGIVKKCDGLPLALKALGRVLKTKGNEEVEWKELLNNEIWNLKDESSILPALKLSYYDLPSHLKQLFAYCSLFPKDYVFEKKKLVLLWMAQGFLSQPKGNNQPMESLGGNYFKELLSRSFFQPLGNDESLYIMHELMNDLATSVAGEFFFRLDENMDLNGNKEAYEKFRHFSYIDQRVPDYKKFKELHRARCLRTFLPFLPVSVHWKIFNTLDNVIAELLPQLHFIRVLSLTDWSITKVPQSIGNLKHLRYLNFSATDIKQIPEEVSELYNLQSLLVRGCGKLSRLPVSFVKLINLRHLDLANTWSLKKLPLGIGGLTSLQTLSKVIVEGDNVFKISELKGLKDLQGELSIRGLEKVIDLTEAKDANLQEKKDLDDLELVWGDTFDDLYIERVDVFNDSRDPVIEYEVLERLRAPHSNLKKLKIRGYGGMKFPSWLGDPSFDRLIELVLKECHNSTELATLGHLTSLQKLEVLGCSKLESIKGENEVVNVGSSIMGSIRQVRLSNCDSLKSYCCPNSVEWLHIENCSSMTSLRFSKLQEDLPSSSSSSSSKLKFLTIKKCKNIKSISQEHLQRLTSLQQMFLVNCPSMEDSFPLCGLFWPPNLRKLKIGKLKKPMSEWGLQNYPPSLVELELNGRDSGVVSFGIMEEQDHNNMSSTCFLLPPSLTKLRIWNFEKVKSYCCPNSIERLEIEDCDSMTSLSFSKLQEEGFPSSSSNLKTLWIINCKNIKSISQEHLQNLTSLEEMLIYTCPSLEDSFTSCGFWPPNLKYLNIGELKKPMSEWGPQNYPRSLVVLILHGRNSGVVSFGIMKEQYHNITIGSTCFLLPPSLTFLRIRGFEEVESVSEVLQHLPHLQHIQINNCPKIRDVPETTSSLRVDVSYW